MKMNGKPINDLDYVINMIHFKNLGFKTVSLSNSKIMNQGKDDMILKIKNRR